MLIRFQAKFGQGFRKIYREFMGRRVLARVVAFGAVVAQIREVAEVAIAEGGLALERWEYGAVAFAIAAGVADGDQALGFPE